jgi:hypothetical protein
MGQYAVPNSQASQNLVGYVSVPDPLLFLQIDGVTTSSAYMLFQSGLSTRMVFPSYQNGAVYLNALDITFTTAIPQQTVNVSVKAAA